MDLGQKLILELHLLQALIPQPLERRGRLNALWNPIPVEVPVEGPTLGSPTEQAERQPVYREQSADRAGGEAAGGAGMAVQPEWDLGDRNPAAVVDPGEYRNEGLLAPCPTVHNANEMPVAEGGVQGQILDTGFSNPPLFATPREELGSMVPLSIKETNMEG